MTTPVKAASPPRPAQRSWQAIPLARRAGRYLADKHVPNADLDAELLLAYSLGIGRLDIYLQHDRPITSTELEAYRGLVRRRAKREPLQYVTGQAAFRDLELAVDDRVLVPRPETETLVGEVLAWAGRRTGERTLSALDIGTGSGAIALSLLAEGPFARVVATDPSPDALDVAQANARALGLAERMDLRQGSFFDPVTAHERFDVIVSNPPYISTGDLSRLEPEVRDWEPAAALDGGPDGLDPLTTIVGGARPHLASAGLLALEVGTDQASPVRRLIESSTHFTGSRICHDLAGRERVVLGRHIDHSTN